MGKANYADKVKLKESGLPAINSWRDVDANEVKDAINDNDDRITDLEDGGEGSLPIGGTTSQVLAKKSDIDYDVEWRDGGTGGATTADDVSVDTTPFNKNLSSADTDAQKALETLDQLDVGSGGGTALSTTTDVTNFDNNLSAADTDVQKALDTIDNLDIGGSQDLQEITDNGSTTTNPITAPSFISSEYGKTEQYVDAAPIGSISTIDWVEGDAFMIDDSAVALTLVFTNLPPSGRVKQISVYVKGNRPITLPSGIYISNEGVPSSTLWNQLVFEVLTSTGDVVNFGTVQINILDNQTV